MSYILDALKKSEQERQRGAIPSISSQHRGGSPQRPKKPGWRSLIIVVLLLNVGVFLWWLKPWQGEPEEQPPLVQVDKQAQSSPAAPRGAAANSGGTKRGLTPAPLTGGGVPLAPFSAAEDNGILIGEVGQEAPPAAGAGQGGKPVKSRRVVEKQKTLNQTPLPVPAGGATVADTVRARPAAANRQATRPAVGEELYPPSPDAGFSVEDEEVPETGSEQIGRGAQEAEPTLAGREPEDSPAAGETAEETMVAPADTAANEDVATIGKVTLDYRQLPLSLRQQLPELSISVLLYAERPERRKVSIDGRMMREKEQIAKDLILEEITPDGVVFNYAGRRFQKKVFR